MAVSASKLLAGPEAAVGEFKTLLGLLKDRDMQVCVCGGGGGGPRSGGVTGEGGRDHA
jgi:hypothetical protein